MTEEVKKEVKLEKKEISTPERVPATSVLADIKEQDQNPFKVSKIYLILALVTAFTVLIAGAFYLQLNTKKTAVTPTFPEQTPQLFLNLESPAQDTLVTDNKVIVKGKTLPNTLVMFFTEADQNSVESDAGGQFEGELTLENGINTLTVTAYGENGDEKQLAYNLVYDQAQ